MEFQVNINQVILSKQDQVESGEYNVTECNFTFSSEFDGLTKKAVFTGEDGTAYLQTIVDNKCSIPSEILATSQVVQIGVYAYAVENEELILRYSPEPTEFFIHQGSYKEAQNSTPPTPTEIEQLQSQITSNKNDIEEIQGDIAEINQTLGAIATDIEKITGDISDIKAEQIEQNTNIQNNTDDITEINNSIGTINSNINDIQGDIADIKAEQITQNGDIQTNANDILDIKGEQITQNQNIQTNAQNISNETLNRQQADNNLQSQIDAITVSSDVIDVLGTYQDLQNYDTSHVKANDIIKVLQDSTHNDSMSYYRWVIVDHVGSWQYVGSEGPYYTKSETDSLLSAKANSSDVYDKSETYDKTEVNTLLNGKVDKVEGKGLSTEDFTTAEKTKLAGIEAEANKTIVDNELNNTSENPVQNKVIYEALSEKQTQINNLQTDVEDLRGACLSVEGTGTDITLNNTAKGRLLKNELSGRTEQTTSILPNEYQQVEYIEADGTQYINTAITSDKTKKLKFETSIMWSSDITTRQNMGGDYGQFFGIRNGVYQIGIEDTTIAPSTNKFDKIIAEFDMPNNNGFINVNGTTKNFTRTNWVNILLYLFGLKLENGVLPRYFSKCKMKYFRIYKGNVLAGEFIPCYKISDSTIGMYDTITNTFFTNAGTGTFAKGNDVTIPNPDFPQQIKNVTGNCNVKIQNRNLQSGQQLYERMKNFNPTYVWKSTVENKKCINFFNSQFMTLNLFEKYKPNTQYTILGSFKWSSGGNGSLHIIITYTDNSTTSKVIDNYSYWNKIKITSTANKTIKKISFSFGTSCVWLLDINSWLIAEGNVDNYVSHQEQNYPFTFEEGQRGMQGTKLLDDGIHNKHKQKIFDGTETFWNITMAGDIPCFWFRNSDIGAKNNPHNKKCNYFIYSSLGFRSSEINTLCENESATPLFIFKTNIANSIETWKQWLAQRYANGTPVIVEYELKEEEIIPYNETQQAQHNAIKEARSYDDQTNITSESDELGFDVNVVAVADANKVIDSELQEIKSAVIALGGDLNV